MLGHRFEILLDLQKKKLVNFEALVDAGRIIRHDVLSLSTALLVPLSAVSINYFAFDHPYLLADNRHISSIIWRRLLGPVQVNSTLCFI